MHTLNQMDPQLYKEVVRRRAQMWDELITAFMAPWDRLFRPQWMPENRISVEDVLFDLAHGRD
jgi:hypothetical protein